MATNTKILVLEQTSELCDMLYFQMGKARLREAERLNQSYIASEWQIHESPGHPTWFSAFSSTQSAFFFN